MKYVITVEADELMIPTKFPLSAMFWPGVPVSITGVQHMDNDWLWENHIPGEATGGYIECSCGYPTKEQWDNAEHYAVHVLGDAE